MDINNLKIVLYPDPILTKSAASFDPLPSNIQALADRMIELMVQANGVGLAGPQVGIAKRIFVASPTGKAEDARVFINPELSEFEGSAEQEEGCLSLPGIHVNVHRPASCRVSALDAQGTPFSYVARDLEARVIQHETDHLNGVLIIDKLNPLERIVRRKAIRELERQYQKN